MSTIFEPDPYPQGASANKKLAELLYPGGAWSNLEIVKIDRLEDRTDPAANGWLATYR